MKVLKSEIPEINWDQKFTIELSLKELLMMHDAAGYFIYKDIERNYRTPEIPYTNKEYSTFYDDIVDIIGNEIDMESLQYV